jgi:hypothetical protein
MKSVKIQVKVGSHSTNVNLNDIALSCQEFIKTALIQCNVVKQTPDACFSTYSLFERLNGIELIIGSDENIFTLWLTKWKKDKNIELIIKKYRRSSVDETNQKRMSLELNKKKHSKINKFIKTTEKGINRNQLKLKKRIKYFLSQDFSYFDNLTSDNNNNKNNNNNDKQPNEIKQIDSLNHHYEEINDESLLSNLSKCINNKFNCFASNCH